MDGLKYTLEFIDNEAEALLEWAQSHAFIPFLEEFAVKRGYYSDKIAAFSHQSEKFARALLIVKDIQLVKCATMALRGELSTAFAIFTMKNISKWKDNPQIQFVGKQLQIGSVATLSNRELDGIIDIYFEGKDKQEILEGDYKPLLNYEDKEESGRSNRGEEQT